MTKLLVGISDVLRAVGGKPKKRHVTAVIVAAGSGTRFGSDVPKQFAPINGVPTVVHTLTAYQNADYITDIVVVGRDGDAAIYDEYKKAYGITKLRETVVGGATRRESALKGLEAIDRGTAYVAIADAARPLVRPEEINEVCLAAMRHRAASAAYPVADSLKRVDSHGFICEGVDREGMFCAATPQVFEVNLYRAAAYYAADSGFDATDDNSLVENIGRKVKIVPCSPENIKITYRSDVLFAEAVIAARNDEKEARQNSTKDGKK